MKNLQRWLAEYIATLEGNENPITEHDVILKNVPYEVFQEFPKLKEYFNAEPKGYLNEPNPNKSLGLYWELNNLEEVNFKLRAFYYVGYWWVSKEERVYIRVAPKRYRNKAIDFLAVLKELLEDDEISQLIYNHLDGKNFSRKLIHFDFEGPLIPLEDEAEEFFIFTIFSFLYFLEKILRKGLKRDYVKVSENLHSRLKGKILIKETLQRNIFKGNLTRNYCSFYQYSEDILENQILKTTLVQIHKFLLTSSANFLKNSLLEEKVGFLLRNLKNVNTAIVNTSDFQKVSFSPLYKEYKPALILAKAILKRLGLNPFSPIEEVIETNLIVPYWINMPLLFELYAYKWLKQKFEKNTILYQKEFKTSAGKFIPDFLVVKTHSNPAIVADAKYKYIERSPNIEDLKQLSLYGRIKDLKTYLGLSEKEEPKLWFLIPSMETEKNEKVENFTNVFKILIKIPIS